MAVPKRRTSTTRKGKRRSHHALKLKNVIISKETGFPVLSHRVCKNTGKYRGKIVIKTKKD